ARGAVRRLKSRRTSVVRRKGDLDMVAPWARALRRDPQWSRGQLSGTEKLYAPTLPYDRREERNMLKRGDPKVLRLVVKFLRSCADMTQEDFGRAARVAQGSVSEYELGHSAPPEESLRRMAAVAKTP